MLKKIPFTVTLSVGGLLIEDIALCVSSCHLLKCSYEYLNYKGMESLDMYV